MLLSKCVDCLPLTQHIVEKMENSALKNKFKTFIQKTEKLKLDFNKSEGSSSDFGGKIPQEWAKLIAVSPGIALRSLSPRLALQYRN